MNAIPVTNLNVLVRKWRAEATALKALRPMAVQLGQREAEMLDNCAEAYDGAADDLAELIGAQLLAEQPAALTLEPVGTLGVSGARFCLSAWVTECANHQLTDDDGSGYWGVGDMISNQRASPKEAYNQCAPPRWADCVYWYNK